MNATIDRKLDATLFQKLAATFLPAYAYFSIMGIPMIFGGLIGSLSIDAATATYATTAQVAAMSTASLLVSVFLQRMNLRMMMLAGFALAIAGQAFTLTSTNFSAVVAARAVIGLGEGLCVGLGLAYLAQVRGGAKFLSHVGSATALFTWLGFLVVPSLADWLGPKAIFWYGLGWGLFSLLVALAMPSRRLERRAVTEWGADSLLDRRNIAIFSLLVLSCIGACACWIYFEKVGESAGLDLKSVGLVGSTATLISASAPFLASYVFNRWGGIFPLVAATLVMGICAHFYVSGVATTFWIVVIMMSSIFVFLMAYARLYSAEIDPSGRATAAVGGADAIGLLIGPVIAAAFLDLSAGFHALGQLGAILQFICVVPALLLALTNRARVAKPIA